MHTGLLRSSAILLSSLLIYSPLLFNQPSIAADNKDSSKKDKTTKAKIVKVKPTKTGAEDRTDLHKASAQAISHPLDPLTMSELEDCVSVLKSQGKLGKHDSLVSLSLHEPTKDFVLSWKSGDAITRKADALVYRIETNETHEIIVDITNKQVFSEKLKRVSNPGSLKKIRLWVSSCSRQMSPG